MRGPSRSGPVQIGYKRAGWYGYDLLDNAGIPSADRIIPELQHIKVGDTVPIWEGNQLQGRGGRTQSVPRVGEREWARQHGVGSLPGRRESHAPGLANT